MTKLKRALAMMLSLVMIAGLVLVPAYAAEGDHSARIYLTNTTIDEQNVLKVEMQIKTSSTAIKGVAECVVFDSDIFSLVKPDGTAIELGSTKQSFKSDSGAYTPNTSFTLVNQMSAILSGSVGIVGIQNINMTADQVFADYTACGTFYLAYKAGKSVSDVTATSIRWAEYAEASKITFSNYVAVSESSATYSVGNSDSSKDNAALAAASTIAPSNFTFAKPAYSGDAATITSVAKSGGNVVVTATIPSGETGEYGYSTTNSAASVSNWQSSSSFATPAPGTYYFFARVAENSEHKAGGESESKSYTVNGPLSLSYTAPASMTVDTAIADMAPTVGGGSGSGYTYAVTAGTLPTGLSLNAATGVISGTPTAVAAAADVTITVTDSDSDTKTCVIHFPAVAKKVNTMTSVTQANVEYGTAVSPSVNACNGNTPTFEYKVKGAGDGTYTTTKPTAVGEYTVRASSTGHAKVEDAIVTADFKIEPKTLTGLNFTGVTVTKEYDRTTSAGAVTGTITFTGAIGSDDVSIKAVAGTYDNANAGTGKTVTLTLSLDGADKGNYRLASYTQSFNAAAITAAGYTYTVAGTQTFRTGSGLSAITVAPTAGTGVNGESVTGTLAWYSDESCTTPAVDADLSGVAADGTKTLYWKFTATNGNYTDTPKTGSTVFTAKDKEELTIDVSGITGLSKTYDGTPASYTGSATVTDHTGLDSSLVYEWYKSDDTKLAGAPTNAGDYYLKVSIPDSNADYIGSAKVNFTIGQREVTVAAGTYKVSKTYDGTVNVGSATGALSVTGILPADSGVTVQATPVPYSSNGVGVQTTMNVNIELNGTGKENYKIKDDAATVTVPCEITPKAITIASAAATDRDYIEDDVSVETDVTFTGAIGTLTKGTDYTVTGEMTDANAGDNKTVTVTVTLTNGNYSLAVNTTTTTVTIDKIDWTGSKTAAGAAKYGTTGSVDLSSYLKDGYVIGSITKTNGSIFDSDPEMNGTDLTFTFANVSDNVGQTAVITVPVTSTTNYNSYEIKVTVTVDDKMTPTVTAPMAVAELTYDGTEQVLISAGSTTGGTIQYKVDGGEYSTALPTGKNAKTYTVYYKVVGNSEYADVEEHYITVTIAPKALIISPKSYIITQGQSIPTFELEYDGLVDGDPDPSPDATNPPVLICTDEDGNPVDANTPAGVYTITWTNPEVYFYGVGNYTLTREETGTLTIKKPSIAVIPTTYTVTVEPAENGTVTANPTSAASGTAVTVTATPGAGYVLKNLTVLDKDGKELALTEKDGKYTFTMPAGDVTVTAVFVCGGGENCPSCPYMDVDTTKWYHEAVDYVINHKIMNGYGGGIFAPGDTVDRATIVQILYNLEGRPAVSGDVPFTDVAEGAWYHDAVLWAASHGIVEGSGSAFWPKGVLARQEMVVILFRYADYKGYDTTAWGDLSAFADGGTVAAWAEDAMSWAVGAGILSGRGSDTLSPEGSSMRCEVAKFFMNFCENIVK